MQSAYNRLQSKYKILVIVGLTLLSTILGFQVGEPLLLGGGTAFILLSLHLFLTYKGNLMTVGVIIAFLFVSIALLLSIQEYGAEVLEMLQIDLTLVLILYSATQLVSLTSYLYLSTTYGRGAVWINLGVAFILQGIGAIVVLVINPSFYILALILGLIVGWAWLALRIVRPSKKPNVTLQAVSSEAYQKTSNLLKNMKLPVRRVEPESHFPGVHYLTYTDSALFAITILSPKKEFNINSVGVFSDGVNQAPVFEFVQSEIHRNKKTFPHITKNAIHVVLVISKKLPETFPTNTSIRITRWKQPNYTLGNTIVCTPEGLKRLLRASQGEMKSLTGKTVEDFANFAGFYEDAS